MDTAKITDRKFTYSAKSGGLTTEATGKIGTDISASLEHGDSISVYGLLATVRYNVKKQNDTLDEYKTKITDTKAATVKKRQFPLTIPYMPSVRAL